MRTFDQAAAWNQISTSYQERAQIPCDDLYYGPWSPPESDLRLLGKVAGLRVLDLGCGGGQAAIYLARQGASVTGMDISQKQLAFAEQQAHNAGVAVRWVQGGMATLNTLPAAGLDLIISIATLHYVAELPDCLAACHHCLRVGGRLIFSVDHPLRSCFFDAAEQELTLYPERSYFDTAPRRWRFPGTNVQMETYHYTIEQWLEMIHKIGFRLLRLVEPTLPSDQLQELWPDDDPLSSMRNLPHTIIFCLSK